VDAVIVVSIGLRPARDAPAVDRTMRDTHRKDIGRSGDSGVGRSGDETGPAMTA
jgi:hypothetical protein